MKDYRNAVIERLDAQAFYTAQVGETKRLNASEQRFLCPFHDDTEPSANFNIDTGVWFCHVCNVGGSPIDFLMRKGESFRDALAELGKLAGVEPPTKARRNGAGEGTQKPRRPRLAKSLSEDKAKDWHEAALRNTDLMKWFHDKRGFSVATVKRWLLGWDGERVTIPIRDSEGTLINVRRYLRDSKGAQGKMLSLAQGTGAAVLWPTKPLEGTEIIMVEGEWDAMLMHQQGFTNTMTVTSGAGTFKPDWVDLFKDKNVVVMFDNDDAGRKGAIRVAGMLSGVATTSTLQVTGLPDKGDVTDFFVEQQRDADELRTALLDATPYIVATTEIDDMEAIVMPLGTASEAAHRDQLQEIPVMVSGKGLTPYTVPNTFTIECDMGNKKYCAVCPLAESAGRAKIKLDAKDPKALSLINVTDAQQYSALKGLAKAIEQCQRPKIEIIDSTNIEELRLIPELDNNQTGGEVEYVSRTGYLLGHGLRTNRSYKVIGYAHPHPKTQATVHLLREAIPAQDNISSFSLNDEVRRQLEIFQGDDVDAKLADIYDDMRMNVHRIQGRPEMQIAFDLVWHSAIAFYFNGAFVRRGWVETLIIGDSGQGKTEMAMALLQHYRLGERVQAEQASMAGLLGGLEKMGDTWILSWGKLALNDKRLLIIDETQGLNANQIEALSDVRATGVAEITKIRTERTNARCRIVWLANPSTGRPLAQYNQGVLAIKDVFRKPEDIRRLDFAIATATGDVDLREINARHGTPVPPRYSSEACRSLVLWAWSRTPDQISFTPEATEAILAAAMDFGQRYHPSIPIVEPADQRLKFARLAVATAARMYSTDSTGEILEVRPTHVEFVRSYLDRIYDSRGLSYLEYSKQQRLGESLEPGDRTAVLDEIRQLESMREALDFFRQAKVFRKTECEEVIGWSSETTKHALKMLSKYRCIRTTRDGYIKQPVFIELLRDIAANPIEPLSDEEIKDLPWEGDLD
ncbi:MAG: hypothetical protein DRH30_00555 [Deltaproteobacteria bacterium]|nr:MAG: hypothetical protein DRH30_00555 [Deltaproteobacteria bacterium]